MKVKKILFILSFVMLQYSFLYSQNWKWIEEGIVNAPTNDECFVAADTKGNVYRAGDYENVIKFGRVTLNTSVTEDYLVKYDSSGNVLWAVQPLSVSSNALVYGGVDATDDSGNAFLAGIFKGTIKISSFQYTSNAYNLFIAKYDSSGNPLWARESESYNNGNVRGTWARMCTDIAGNLLITGSFTDNIIFGADTLAGDSLNMFLVKYDKNGNVLWARQSQSLVPDVYGDWYVSSYSISSDKAGNIYVTGVACGTTKFGNDTLHISNPTGNYFVVKYDASGNTVWSSIFPYGWPYNITNDNACSVYISGHDNYIGGMGDALLAKYDSAGNFQWIEKTNGIQGGWYGDDVTTDSLNNVYLIITALNDLGDSVSFAGTKLCYTKTGDGTAAFLLKLDTSGKGTCYSLLDNGWEFDPQNIITCNPSGKYIYMGGGIGYSLIVNTDTVTDPAGPYVVRWNYCCRGIHLSITADSICTGDSVTLSANGGTSFLWSTGNTSSNITIKPTGNSKYSVSVKNLSCVADSSITVHVFPYPTADTSSNQSICQGNSVQISTSGGSIYSWSNGSSDSTITVSPVTNTTYSVTISNGQCTLNDSVKVFVNKYPVLNLCCDSIILRGQNVQLISNGGGSYSWSPATGLSCDTCPSPVATPHQTTTYTLTVISDSGCVATKYVTIDVTCGDVFIPNVFSPNTAYNSILYVRGPCIENLEFEVFDRWGNRVFESQNPDIGWDGNHNGTPMNMGTYMYYAKATMYDGSIIEKHGDVTLVR